VWTDRQQMFSVQYLVRIGSAGALAQLDRPPGSAGVAIAV
jgi:hypothetical protein